MIIKILQRAEDGERFAPDAFASQVGKRLPVNVGSAQKTGTVVAVEVVEDGTAFELYVELADTVEPVTFDLPPMSFRPRLHLTPPTPPWRER